MERYYFTAFAKQALQPYRAARGRGGDGPFGFLVGGRCLPTHSIVTVTLLSGLGVDTCSVYVSTCSAGVCSRHFTAVVELSASTCSANAEIVLGTEEYRFCYLHTSLGVSLALIYLSCIYWDLCYFRTKLPAEVSTVPSREETMSVVAVSCVIKNRKFQSARYLA